MPSIDPLSSKALLTVTRTEIQSSIKQLYQAAKQAIPDDESGRSLNDQFQATLAALDTDNDYIFPAETLLTNLITFYPNLTPAIPRELLWAVGGSCMHFLSDEEIEHYSSIDSQTSLRH